MLTVGVVESLTAVVRLGEVGLSWRAPATSAGASITDYIIQYRNGTSEPWGTFPDGISTATTAVVAGLTVSDSYDFRVAAVATIGTGPWSESCTFAYGFSNELLLTADWIPAGSWRLESDGVRLQHWNSSLTSKQSFGSGTKTIEFAYEITDRTQLWVSLWGETFVFEPPLGGGAVTAQITRDGEAVTFTNGITSPTTVILKQANKDVATPLLIRMDQLNLWRPEMELLLTRVAASRDLRTTPKLPSTPSALVAFPSTLNAMQLAWAAPADGGSVITDYLVQYSMAGSGTWVDFTDGVAGRTHAFVNFLDHQTEYVFRVAAVNAIGVGPWSAASLPIKPGGFSMPTDTRHHVFSHEGWFDAEWAADGEWRLESTGTRLMNHQAKLTSKQSLVTRHTRRIEIAYEITPTTQLWVSLWGETFRFEPPAGGGAAVAEIIRNGEAVTFSNGVTQPTTVVLKQQNKDVATPLVIQMDQRNLYRPTMELLVKRIARGQEIRLSAVRPDAPSTVAAAPGNRSRDVQLFWTAPGVWDIPDVGKPITDYLIQSSADAGATWTDVTTATSSSTHTTVTNLDPGREYVFRVAAVNAVGIGPWSAASVPVRPRMDVVTAETRHFGFSHEAWLDASWTTAGAWRIESDGIRLQHWTSSLTSKQSFGSDTQSIEFSYEITDRTQMWVSLWGETFVFEAPAGGGAATARITRNGEAVTFTNGITSPTTVILKQANKDVATPLLIQMDQRNLSRPEMELLVKQMVAVQENKSFAVLPISEFPQVRTAYTRSASGAWTRWDRNSLGFGEEQDFYHFEYDRLYLVDPITGPRYTVDATRPHAPPHVWVAPGNRGGSMNIFWTAPRVRAADPMGGITDYLIQYSPDDGARWVDYATGTSIVTADVVMNLDPGVEYLFRVAAVSARGVSDWSKASAASRPSPIAGQLVTQRFGFSHEGWLDASWATGGVWRIESDGIRLQHWTSSLTSKQSFGSDTQSIEFSYEITDRTQMWVSLWGETFVFEAPAVGGAATARITRNGEAVTFTNGITSPTTVILKQANKDVATPLLIQMDQRNMYRPEMELLVKSVELTTARTAPFIVNPGSGETLTDETPHIGSYQLVKRGLGTLVLNQINNHSGGTVVEHGELVARNPAAFGIGSLQVHAGAKVTLDVGTRQVSVSGLELSSSGVLDLATGSLRIAPGGYDLTEIRGLLSSARGNGSWSGSGITSSSIQSGTSRAVGYRVLQDGSLLLGYAAVGDANMDGQVDLIDMLGVLAANTYNAAVTAGWSEGDFNYDGATNLLDLLAVLGSGEYGQGNYLDRDSGVTSAQPSDSPEIEAAPESIAASASIGIIGAPGSTNQPEQQVAAIQTTTASSPSPKKSTSDHVDQLAWAAIANGAEITSGNDRRQSRQRPVLR